MQHARKDFLLAGVLRVELFSALSRPVLPVHAETAITAPSMNDTPKETPKPKLVCPPHRRAEADLRVDRKLRSSDLVSKRKLDAATIEELGGNC